MLATAVEPLPQPAGWVYEPKLDGIRCLAVVSRHGVQLYSRNRIAKTEAYPEIAAALGGQVRGHAILDGEIVAVDRARGVADFGLLQRGGPTASAVGSRGRPRIEYWLFDCLWYEGIDLRPRAWRERRQVLESAVAASRPLVLTPTHAEFGAAFARACARGGEGLVAKRIDAPYRAGRSPDWRKLKCVRGQELVVGGWTDPRGSRQLVGALLVGYFDAGALRYAGKVGTGFDRFALRELSARLAPLAQAASPFAGAVPIRDQVHWVRPDLVVQVGFSEWTRDGRLRHPRYLGIRSDKRARDVVREPPG
jgi:bifunctional non-homologous end joining protein LigD